MQDEAQRVARAQRVLRTLQRKPLLKKKFTGCGAPTYLARRTAATGLRTDFP
jgi:hypothetical protein